MIFITKKAIALMHSLYYKNCTNARILIKPNIFARFLRISKNLATNYIK